MRIIRFLDDQDQLHWGRDLREGTAERMKGTEPWALTPTGERIQVVRLRSPVEPRAILCIGLNYRRHAEETGQSLPERPALFMKNPASVQHPAEPIVLPRFAVERPEVDYEVELAVVLHRQAKNVRKEEALEYVFGYTIGHDVSARRVQKQGGAGQWVRGKSFDTFCPLGPALVTRDEIPDPQTLAMSTRLNGQTMQDSHTSDMIFGVADLVADLSAGMTLLPGTVILTGTPEGVGFVREPRVFLMPGDTVELTIEKIGTLTNPVVAA